MASLSAAALPRDGGCAHRCTCCLVVCRAAAQVPSVAAPAAALPRNVACLCAELVLNLVLQDLARTWRVAEALDYGMIGCNEVRARLIWLICQKLSTHHHCCSMLLLGLALIKARLLLLPPKQHSIIHFRSENFRSSHLHVFPCRLSSRTRRRPLAASRSRASAASSPSTASPSSWR